MPLSRRRRRVTDAFWSSRAGRHRQEPAARGRCAGAPSGRLARARRARQRARARVRVRRRAPAASRRRAPARRARARASTARPPARAACSAAPAPTRATAGDASFAALHGLYWLPLNLAAERPLLLAVDDLHWCDRPSLRFLAYLARRLEGPAGPAGGHAALGEPGTDPALLGEIAGDCRRARCAPGRSPGPAVEELVRERLGRGRRRPRSRRRATRRPAATRCCSRQLLSALAADGVRPTRANAGACARSGPRAVSRAVLLRLARLRPRRSTVARASRCSARTRGCPRSPRSPDSTSRALAAAHARRAGSRRDPAAGAAARLRPPARARRRLPRAAARRARAPARARRPHLLDAGGRARAGGGAPAADRAARRGVGREAPPRRPAARRCTRARPRARSPTCGARSPSLRTRGRRVQVLSSWAPPRCSWTAAAAAVHLREAYDLLNDPLARGLAAGCSRAR